MLPAVIFEDEHLLVVNKPAGLNTHAPSPYAGEGLYDWLRHREPRWAGLAIIHRLDKETSGVMVFSKTPLASRSLTAQFTNRSVRKKYVLLTDRRPGRNTLTVRNALARSGGKYVSVTKAGQGEAAETHFEVKGPAAGRWEPEPGDPLVVIEALPRTGRTHQIRVHAAESGFPILGDVLYGGTPASRVFLHASELTLKHPASEQAVIFQAAAKFEEDPRLALRRGLIDPGETSAFRIIHGASDSWPGWYVDRLGDYLLSQSEQALSPEQTRELANLERKLGALGVYNKTLSRRVRETAPARVSPERLSGEPASERFLVRENSLNFELSLTEGYSVGLFLDQRDNRRRLLKGHVAADFPLSPGTYPALLNTFAYTCGFSVCAARAGFQTTSLDLSKKYLDWGKRNFALNELGLSGHDFIFGDVFDWLHRLAKKQRVFDLILLDPPTFSQSRQSGPFRAESDYGRLVASALGVLRRGGVLFASSNAARWPAEEFLGAIEAAATAAKRPILQRHYVPQPPDFPISRSEPAYLKTVWLKLG